MTVSALFRAELRLLLRRLEIVDRAVAVLGSQRSATLWMQTPQVALGEKIPLELCRTAAGRRKVMDVLGAIEDGG